MARNSPKEDKNDWTLDDNYRDLIRNKELLRKAAEQYMEDVIDDISMAVVFEIHREMRGDGVNIVRVKEEDATPRSDIFGSYNFKKKYMCSCKNCNKIVEAVGFAPHLQSCMGMGTSRFRNSARRVANNNRENPSYGEATSEDEDDVYWNSNDKRKKKRDRNRSRKSKGTPKKNSEPDNGDSPIDVEGEADDILSLRDLLQDYARGTSPTDSVSSSGSSKRRDRNKSKKRKDRSSPNPSRSFSWF